MLLCLTVRSSTDAFGGHLPDELLAFKLSSPGFCKKPVKTSGTKAPNTSEVSFLFLITTVGSGDNVGAMQTLGKPHLTYQHAD